MSATIIMKLESKNIITQSNRLVEARYSLSVYEQRLVLMMISMIEPQDEDFKDYVIKISDFISLLGLKGESAYSRVKSILRSLRAKELLIENGKDYLVTGWISSAEYKARKGEIYLSFDKKLKPFLLSLKQEFVSQRLDTVIQFKSIYSIRIYALLKQYEKIGVRDFDLSTLKTILGLKANQYPVYSNFRARVIVPAQKELSTKNANGAFKSDLGFEIEPIKTGRKITGLKFIIIKQNTNVSLLPNNSQSKSFELLSSYGVGKSKIEELIGNHSEKEIVRCIEIFEQKRANNQVKTGGVGLLIKLIEDGAGLKTQVEVRQEESEQLKLSLEKQKRLDEQRERLSRDFNKKVKEYFLDSLPEKDEQRLLEQALEENKGSPLLTFVKKDGLKATFLSAFVLKNIPNYEAQKEKYISENL